MTERNTSHHSCKYIVLAKKEGGHEEKGEKPGMGSVPKVGGQVSMRGSSLTSRGKH